MVKRLLLLTIILLLSQITVGFSQITIGTIDPGPYTPGSSIAATFKINPTSLSCIPGNNEFSLHLVYPDGTEVTTPIGTYVGFYSTFVNGIIPPGTPAGSGYQLRISSSAPAQTTLLSNAFDISPGTTPVIASLDADEQDKISLAPLTFGNCNTDPNIPLTDFWFTNNSSTDKVTVQIIDELNLAELNPVPTENLTFTSINQAKKFAASLAHYTMIVRAEAADGTIGIHAYFLVNNLTVTAFTTTSGNTVCYPTGAFEYTVGVSKDDGIGLNFPGNTYIIDWGDGTSNEYTYCQIVNDGKKVRHNYNQSSCGLFYTSGNQTHFNAFGVNVNVESPFCGPVGAPLSTPARVVERPENKFRFTPIACVGDEVTFFNESTPGQRPNTTSLNCVDNNMRYDWYIDGVLVGEGLRVTDNFTYTFPAKRKYMIRLTSSGAGACPADDLTLEICVQDKPEPIFTLPSNLVCLTSGTLTPSEASLVDNSCGSRPVYIWNVTPSTGVTYGGGTNQNSTTPQFQFSQIGIYNITLTIQTGYCEVTSQAQRVVVNAEPQASLSPRADLCQNGSFEFSPNATITKTTINGNAEDLPDTYTWEITGGESSFVSPSTANSKYPTINFSDYATYTIKLTYQNNCNTITRTQIISFSESPIPSITAIPNPICYDADINLQGSITNRTPQVTYSWLGAGSFAYPDPTDHLIAIYTPTPDECNNGTARIRLMVNTGLEGLCAQVEEFIDVTITPNNTTTNPTATRTQSICTGELAKFNPTSVDPTSTFTWVATNEDGFATGFTPNGNGNINDVITNTNATQDAVIVYNITPATTACTGVPFMFTVIVKPKPILTPIPDKTICSGNSAALTVASNIQTQFIWTSVATNGITGHSNPSGLSAASGSININDVLTNPSNTPGTVTYTIKSFSASATGCEGNTTTVIVTVYPKVTQAKAGPDATLCAISPSNTYTLEGNTANVGTGQWSLVSTHIGTILPIIIDPADPHSKVTGLLVGETYRFEWAITGTGECANTSDWMEITVTPLPIISAPVTTKTICHGEQAAVIINSDIPTKFTWTSVATPGITGNIDRTDLITTLRTITIDDELLNSTFTQGKVTYTITPYSATDCAGTPITIEVKVDPKVTAATAGANTSICNTTTYDLNGSEPKVGTGLWTVVSASAGTPSIPNPTDFETQVSDLVAGGIYVFKWTITGPGVCQKSEADVTITVNMPTVPGTTATLEPLVCQNNNTGIVELTGNTGSVLSWQHLPDGQATWVDLPDTNTGLTYTFNNLTVTTQFRAVVQNAGCTIEYSTPTTITVAPATSIAKVEDGQILCAETSVLLKGNPVADGETGVWTMVSGDANALIPPGATEEVTVTNLKPGITYIFRWTINGNAPCGSTYDEIIIRNNEPIDLNSLTSNAVVCNGQQVFINGSVPIGGAENGQYNYIWESQINGGPWEVLTGENGEDLTITLSTTGIINFRRTVNSGNCSSTSNLFPITVQPPIEGNTIGTDQTICNGTTPMLIAGNQLTGGDGVFSYVWQSSPNGTTWTNISSVISADFQPQTLTETTYYRRIVSTLACNGALQSICNTVKINVNPNAKAEFTWGSTDTSCYPYTLPIQVVTHADRNDTYTWYLNGAILPSTSPAFPGYTIESSGQSVTIRLVVTSSLGCAPHEMSHTFSTNQAVPASFDVSDTEGCGPMQVNFTNTSLLIPGARFEWYSGDILFSTDVQPPTTTLQPDPLGKDSTYVIKLKAITDCGIDSITKTLFVKAKPIAVFTPDKVEVCSPSKITFTNTSPGSTNTFYYDFGDGSDIVERTDKLDLEHIYNVTVTTEFTVRMTAKNECDEDVKEWKILVYPQNITPVLGVRLEEIKGCAPHTVHFENNSIGASKFVFDFGDGSPTRTTFASGIVTYTYLTSGNFTVTMTAYNSCSEIPVTKNVEVLPQPVADFAAENTLGCPGLIVKFKNNTLGGLTNSYVWDFGDGSPVSNEFEPEHTYTGDQEYYTVKLLATNEFGCPIEVIKTQFIHIVQPPVAAFNVNPSTLISIPDYTFKFEDESTNNPTIWEWDFGDGTGTSAQRNPSYTYLDTGTYRVTLKVTNQQGCFTTTFKDVTIKGVPGYLFVPNSFIPGSQSPELRLFRAKGSGIKTWRFSIFNKWGQIIWETSLLDEGRPAEAWDGNFKGQPMPQGVYYWKIDVEMINGSEWKGMTYDNTPPKRTGAIHLIR